MNNKASGTIIFPRKERKIEFLKEKATLKELRKCVRGNIEFIWLKDGKILVVNEENKMEGFSYNESATKILNDNGIDDYVLGNALLINIGDINITLNE
jgi:hypothetical protein